jgi:hypothetical protein
MTSAQPFSHAPDSRHLSRALAALVMAVLMLFGAFATIVFVGVTPRERPLTFGRVAGPSGDAQAGQASDSPACAAALRRARASHTLPAGQAIAINTAMLRACTRA